MIPIHHIDTMPVMIALHEDVATGVPAAVALATAQDTVYRAGGEGLAVAAGFVCFGDGLAGSIRSRRLARPRGIASSAAR